MSNSFTQLGLSEYERHYLDVSTIIKGGNAASVLWDNMVPVSIVSDGQVIPITKVQSVVRKAARKSGGSGIRFSVLTDEHAWNLFFDDFENRFFVERLRETNDDRK